MLIHGEDILADGVNIAARLEDVRGGIGVIGIAPTLGFVLGPTRRKMRPASAAKNKDE